MKDLAYRCNHGLDGDLSAEHVFIADAGMKIFFANGEYTGSKRDDLASHLMEETKLIRNYAKLLIQLILKGEEDESKLDGIPELDPELRCIIHECYHIYERVSFDELLKDEQAPEEEQTTDKRV